MLSPGLQPAQSTEGLSMGEPIGFIGLGMMGLPMARSLLRNGQ